MGCRPQDEFWGLPMGPGGLSKTSGVKRVSGQNREIHCARGAPAKTRYSGHLNSRLMRARSKHDQTTGFSYYMREGQKDERQQTSKAWQIINLKCSWNLCCITTSWVRLVLLVHLVWNVDVQLTEYGLYGQTGVELNRFIDVPACQGVLNWDLDAIRVDRTWVCGFFVVRHCPFVTYDCNEEGCGLLADGYTWSN